MPIIVPDGSTGVVTVTDLPAAVQTSELVALMIDAANAKAARVAPCLTLPSTSWSASTAYAVGQTVALSSGDALKVTVAGTSGATAPTAPDLDQTVTDGSVVWVRIGPTADLLTEARLILVGAIQRWSEAGSGSVSTKTTMTGPYMNTETLDTKQRTGFNLWPSEITQLQDLCKTGGTGQAFTVDTAPSLCGSHLPWCSLNFGANYCSCGTDIAWEPIYELDGS
jgi:hypothetical protein